MNSTTPCPTFLRYQIASQLQTEALELLNNVEAQADAGNKKAEQLIWSIWHRYQRRTYKVNQAMDQHWGSL